MKKTTQDYFHSSGDSDHHIPIFMFDPQDDITPKESAICASIISRMEWMPNRDFSEMIKNLGVTRHFITKNV